MKDVESIISLNCNEEIDIKYFAKGGGITNTTVDYGELLEYINEIEDKNESLNNVISELGKYLNEQIQKSWEIEEQCYENIESKLQELNGSENNE